ncbi:G6F5K7 (Putative uncharacterized protein) [Lactobacillus equicursoris DSM 19284 = JCM 14600 = CIP 110162]|uniref:Uncharacterized protein n=1 Tax=Lactobacillus equicursoris DSM 19284 = JCM 14600 = CIP 110162 TaxID=1293597 RepID=K0NXD3_9LACO|nr:hypothetical protein [Lactobacillus equicursoris]KRL00399.1 hypothetical protein FC20_GL001341 [Lactobacillus equicursoris DSM 19284 = JCM 14600 = CIP 110162]CCK86443.1 G6F5K7 (Putative uncharacterized protein) [Lactobacillus equicursoris DSM 19284 = JCM 14600 = CIP 110162]
MEFNNEKRYGYYQKYSPQIGYTLLKPGTLSIYISPEAAKELDFTEIRKIEIMLKDVMKHAQSDSL